MKTIKNLLFGVLLLCYSPANAEKLPLCNILDKILNASDNKFADIKLSEISGEKIGHKYNSSLEIAEANATYIHDLYLSLTFKAEYGTFNSEEAVIAKQSELMKNLTGCFPTIGFTSFKEDLFKTSYTHIINKAEQGLRYYKAGFVIKKYASTYELFFECESASSDLFGGNDKPTPIYTDYFYNDKTQDNSQFSLDIRKLLVEAKTAFVNIKGPETTISQSMFTNYESKFTPSDYKGVYIEERGMKIVNFVIPISTLLTGDKIKTQRDEMFNKIQLALGTDYAYNISDDFLKITFVNKYNPHKNVLTLLLEYKYQSESYNLQIYIDAQ